MCAVSPELALIVAPRQTYARLANDGTRVSWAAALRRPLLVAVIIGVSLAIAATGTVAPALVLSTTLTWSYIVLLQLAIALPLLAPGARRTVGVARGLDLFFAGHAPWSFFALATAAMSSLTIGKSLSFVGALALAPIILTPRIVAAFFREVLQADARTARRLTAAHQALTWTVFVAVNWVASAFTPRLFEVFRWT